MSARPYVLGLLAVAGGLVGVSELADATMTTHEPVPEDSSTRVVVEASTVREGEFPLDEGVRSLVQYCQLEVGRSVDPADIRSVGDDRFEFSFSPGLDDADEDQFHGCIEDMVIDHLQAAVESMTFDPGP